uniref:L1 transposable element RRM domain-containing protein n=1 Tax=Salarias fasciatus TaxID=181472 RepID=A0A672GF89_SALFA
MAGGSQVLGAFPPPTVRKCGPEYISLPKTQIPLMVHYPLGILSDVYNLPARTLKCSLVNQSAAAEIEATMASTETLTVLIEKTLEKHFAKAEAASKEGFTRLEQRLDALRSDFLSLKEETKALKEAHTNLTERTAGVEQAHTALSKTMTTVETKLAEQEDRSRQNNIIVHGLGEGKQGSNALQYITAQLPLWFPILKEMPPEIMKAHRIGPPRSNATAKPRVMIFMCLRYTDRARILKAARDSPLVVGEKEVRFSADYSVATRIRRKSCYPVMEKARRAGFQAFLLYPATIKVSKGHEHNFFVDTTKLEEFLGSHGKRINLLFWFRAAGHVMASQTLLIG